MAFTGKNYKSVKRYTTFVPKESSAFLAYFNAMLLEHVGVCQWVNELQENTAARLLEKYPLPVVCKAMEEYFTEEYWPGSDPAVTDFLDLFVQWIRGERKYKKRDE
jgi:hypothetical protein